VQPQAVLRGGLLASGVSVGILGVASEKRHASHGVEYGHITPEWELRSNLRLLCGNHSGISSLQPSEAKSVAFTGCCAGTTMESSG
jgi:hypothetical protein